MTDDLLEFTVERNANPATEEVRAGILAEPGFGRYFTDHMVTIRWTAEKGWHDAELKPYGPLTFDPAAMVLHYGQEIFEGLKAYRQPDGSIACFRPDANAARFRRSAARLAMAELPDELFLESIRQLLDVDRDWVPAAGGESLPEKAALVCGCVRPRVEHAVWRVPRTLIAPEGKAG